MRSVFSKMLYVIQVILIALALASALPTSPEQSDQEISENAIDNNSDDFSKELPFEAEYYRTSTEREEFLRPIASPEGNEIDDGDDGIDLDDLSSYNQTPDCTYHIDIELFYQSIERLDIQLDGLTLRNDARNNLTLTEFVGQAQMQLFNSIKGKNLTNDLVNDVINYLRQTFVSVYGYENYCGVSTNVITYFTKNDTLVNAPEARETITDSPMDENSSQLETDDVKTQDESTKVSIVEDDEQDILFESTTNSDEDTTEEYKSRILTRPKLSEIVQKSINFYKAMHNFNFSQQS